MEAITASLLLLAAQFVGAKTPPAPPRIEVVSQATLQQRFCQGKPCRMEAMHLDGTIYLSETTLAQPEALREAVLLHELVHYVQHVNDLGTGTCIGHRMLEDQAYAAQEFYLESRGIFIEGLRLRAVTLICED